MFDSKLYKKYYPVKTEEEKIAIINSDICKLRRFLDTEIRFDQVACDRNCSIEETFVELQRKLNKRTISIEELNAILSMENTRHQKLCMRRILLDALMILALFCLVAL